MSDTLFVPQPYSFEAAPTAKLVKRAEKLTNFEPTRFGG